MEKQMQMAFMEEGGMATDGMERDPVSGNEIPPGSSAEEVRDDIPINISEGEYVIPADVVQFYGVDKLEKMVFKAKEKLGEMEKSGRMGETPEDEDLPLSDEELQVVEEEAPKGFNQGGLAQPSFNPNDWSYSNETDFSTPPAETRTYTNAQGEKRFVTFINGQPQTPIPAGFVLDNAEGRAQLTSDEPTNTMKGVQTNTFNQGQNKEESAVARQAERKDSKPKDYSGVSNEDLMETALNNDMRDFAAKGAALAGGMLAGPVGGLIGRTIAEGVQARNTLGMARELNKRFKEGTLDQSSYDKAMESLRTEESVFDGVMRGTLGVPEEKGGLLSNLLGTKKKADLSPTEGALGSPTQFSGGQSRPSAAPKSSLRPQARPQRSSGGSSSSGGTSGGADSRDSAGVGGNRAKGGLITRKNYKNGGLVKK